jgi:CHAT domain-containing protein
MISLAVPLVSQLEQFLRDLHARQRKGTTTLSIQKFGSVYAISGSHIDPNEPFGPIAPGDVIQIDEDLVKKKIISKFEALSKDKTGFEDLGTIMYNYFLPGPVRDHLEKVEPENLIVMTPTEHDIPWELLHDGNKFWSTRYNMGQVLIENVIRTAEHRASKKDVLKIAAIIADRAGDLPQARKEGEKLEQLVKEDSGISIDVFDPGRTEKIDIIRILVCGNYDIIHYAGHADFDTKDPINSYLKLKDGKLTYDEISRLRFPAQTRPIIFANACSTSKSHFVGEKVIGLASAFIWAGALAYVGTM